MADEADHSTARAGLAALRAELAASYPAFSPRTLVSIGRRFGMERFPDSFLVSGDLADRSADGARSTLKAMASGRDVRPPHPLFSPEFYLLANPDVASAGVSPWAHYQVLGRGEGRAPHPLMDAATLGATMPEVARPDRFDEYLDDPQHWFNDPGPFVDVRNFVLRGSWSPGSHPLVQLTQQLTGPWVHRRLMLVDAATDSTAQSRLVAGAYLLTAGFGRSRLGSIQIFTHGAAQPQDISGSVTIVPGYFVGAEGTERLRLGQLALSPDGTMLRTRTETVGLSTGPTLRTEQLVVLTAQADFATLRDIVAATANDHAALAPFSRSQETALRQLRRDLGRHEVTVLEYGKQARVHTRSLRLLNPQPPVEPPVFTLQSENDPRSMAVVLPVGQRRRVTGDPHLRELVTAGAALCLIDDAGLNTWLPIIQSRAIVLVEPGLAMDVAAFVETGTLRLLPHGSWGRS